MAFPNSKSSTSPSMPSSTATTTVSLPRFEQYTAASPPPPLPPPPSAATAAATPPSPPPAASPASPPKMGPYKPTLILHGGAGVIPRSHLPPSLYAQYHSSLSAYVTSTSSLLESGASALTAAVHAVTHFEDDPLFNCGHGSVFTSAGTIEMEASVMVASVDRARLPGSGSGGAGGGVKRGAGVMMVKRTRHPIQLAREVLLAGGNGREGMGSMHCQLAGEEVERWGWDEHGLERMDEGWFWTRRRWEEHLRGLRKEKEDRAFGRGSGPGGGHLEEAELKPELDLDLPSQGTVGAVCMDSWGDLAVATSTGGLTNKSTGRIGDSPSLGSGFWAEGWDEDVVVNGDVPATSDDDDDEDEALWREARARRRRETWTGRLIRCIDAGFGDLLQDCLPGLTSHDTSLLRPLSLSPPERLVLPDIKQPPFPARLSATASSPSSMSETSRKRRAVAMSGTGNGDSFIRISAVHTAAAICRFGSQPNSQIPLSKAINMVAGKGGELEQSAGDRWMKTGEGQGGIIGIELWNDEKAGHVVWDFNCSGMWRAWIDEKTKSPKVMVFEDEYQV